MARWRREANGEPEPTVDPIATGNATGKATELAAAAVTAPPQPEPNSGAGR